MAEPNYQPFVRGSYVPAGAAADPRLGADHWRMLACLGASPAPERAVQGPVRRLADRIGMAHERASQVIADLAAFGYVADGVDATNSYRVLFNARVQP
jgi:DNA-binding MarR family transcriptional regulator